MGKPCQSYSVAAPCIVYTQQYQTSCQPYNQCQALCNPCTTPCTPCPCPCPCPPPCNPCLSYPTVILAQLNGCNEVPSNVSQGTGIMVGVLSLDASRFDFALQATGLTGTILSAGLYEGAKGINGPLLLPLPINNLTGAGVGSWTSTDVPPLTTDLAARLRSGLLYVNINTTAYPNGEIRGQTLAQTITN